MFLNTFPSLWEVCLAFPCQLLGVVCMGVRVKGSGVRCLTLALSLAGKFLQFLILNFSSTNWRVVRIMAETASSLPNDHAQANGILILFGMSTGRLKEFMSGPPCHFEQKMRCKWKSSCEGSRISLKQNYLSERCPLSLYPQFLVFFCLELRKGIWDSGSHLRSRGSKPCRKGGEERRQKEPGSFRDHQTAPCQPWPPTSGFLLHRRKVNVYFNILL